MKKPEKPSAMYERLARREETERLAYERSLGSGDGQRSARAHAAYYRERAAERRQRGQ
uniref:hypothetical protein n=1 Tax=Actinoplanes sp. CA-084688 TaxID=3239901 RepID=UPI003F491AE9